MAAKEMNTFTFPKEVAMCRFWRTLCCGALLTICTSQLPAADVLSPAAATGKDGQRVTVKLVIRSGGRNGEYQELYSTTDWKEDGCFILRFSPAARDAFAKVNITNLLEYYRGETVHVTGTMRQLKLGATTKPVIFVEDAQNIELVSSGGSYLPKEKYAHRALAGFTVLISPEVLNHQAQSDQAIRFVETQLKTLSASLPQDKLERLRQVPIWIEWQARKDGAAEFHTSADWLRRNGRNPEKAGCVEISNIQNYVQWNREKGVSGMLHELSHAFHNRQLGGDHAGIHAAYEQAMQRRLYDSVRTVNGGNAPAYAKTNEKEYFAEITEAYFGSNDFYPFDRKQLRTHDPVGYELLRKVWLEPLPSADER